MRAPSVTRAGTYLMVLPWSLDAVGGVNQVIFNLYKQFEASGPLRPRVLLHDWQAREIVEEVHSSGIRVTRMRVRPPITDGSIPLDLARYVLTMPAELDRITDLIKRYDVQVVNYHFLGSDALAWSAAKALGVFQGKLNFSLPGLDIRTLAKVRAVRRAIWIRALEAADAVIACSNGLAQETIEAFQLSGRNVVTIHNGVQAERLKTLGGVNGVAPAPAAGQPHLVNLGTFEHKMGHDLLLRAFAKILPRYPAAHLSILGRPAATLESTQALVKELQLQHRVSLRVNVPHEETMSVLQHADVFMLPSRNEAFSVALLEAGAMGKPVVAASVCGVPELIENRVTGILTPPEDVDAIAAGMLAMLDDPAAARGYGERLQQRVLREFTAEGTYRRYSDLVQRMQSAASLAQQ